tara:strand:- start:3120 stop:4418 length:1299 start_codon:yes stop_codon:yes gene_type:complete
MKHLIASSALLAGIGLSACSDANPSPEGPATAEAQAAKPSDKKAVAIEPKEKAAPQAAVHDPNEKSRGLFDVAQLEPIDGFSIGARTYPDTQLILVQSVPTLSFKSVDGAVDALRNWVFSSYYNFLPQDAVAWKNVEACLAANFTPDVDRGMKWVSLVNGDDTELYFDETELNRSAAMPEVELPGVAISELRFTESDNRITFIETRASDGLLANIYSLTFVPASATIEKTFDSIEEKLGLGKMRGRANDALYDDRTRRYFDYVAVDGVMFALNVEIKMEDERYTTAFTDRHIEYELKSIGRGYSKFTPGRDHPVWDRRVVWTNKVTSKATEPIIFVEAKVYLSPMTRYEAEQMRKAIPKAYDVEWGRRDAFGQSHLDTYGMRVQAKDNMLDAGLVFVDRRDPSPYFANHTKLICDALASYRSQQSEEVASPF